MPWLASKVLCLLKAPINVLLFSAVPPSEFLPGLVQRLEFVFLKCAIAANHRRAETLHLEDYHLPRLKGLGSPVCRCPEINLVIELVQLLGLKPFQISGGMMLSFIKPKNSLFSLPSVNPCPCPRHE